MLAVAPLLLLLLPQFGVAAEPTRYEGSWQQFKAAFGKTYHTEEDEERRFRVFRANVEVIKAHASKNLSFSLGVNRFADLTSEEFAEAYLTGLLPEARWPGGVAASGDPTAAWEDSSDPLPEAVDWVEKGAVTGVKDQGQCGSCWSFAVVGAIEGALFLASGRLLSLSEEDLVQCDQGFLNFGCHGGVPGIAYDWVRRNGICTEEDYPYVSGKGETGKCQRSPRCTAAARIGGHGGILFTPWAEKREMMSVVAKQPLSVVLAAGLFRLYHDGIIDSKECGLQPDHAVLVVGYGVEKGLAYWKIKNSWGADWGEQGYVRLARGKNMCGVALRPSYPTGVQLGAVQESVVI